MHLPDGFLDAKTAVLSAGTAVAGVSLALRQVRAGLEPRQMPMLGLAAAFVFAAQMLNFPVAGGTSGHLIGGVLTAILLGPGAAVLVMTCVLIVQCLMFADGGLLALGANVLNMALVSVVGGYASFRVLRRALPMEVRRGMVFAAVFAGWLGTVLAAVACAGQLALSQTVSWSVALPAMAGIHMLIGMGEGLATGLIVLAVLQSRPDLVTGLGPAAAEGRRFILLGLVAAFGLAIFVAPFASPWPDGLERVAAQLGFEHRAVPSLLPAPMPDYHAPWPGAAGGATALAGLAGTASALVAAYALARLLVPGLQRSKPDESTRD